MSIVAESTSSDQAGVFAWKRTRDTLSLALAVEETAARAVLRALCHARDRMCDVIIDVGGDTADRLLVQDGYTGPKVPRCGY